MLWIIREEVKGTSERLFHNTQPNKCVQKICLFTENRLKFETCMGQKKTIQRLINNRVSVFGLLQGLVVVSLHS